MYTLRPEHVQYQKGVVVVGCGGTGGFVAEGLCRLLPRDYTLVLIDGDLVEPANLQRQNFYTEDLAGTNLKPWPSAWPVSFNGRWPTGWNICPLNLNTGRLPCPSAAWLSVASTTLRPGPR